MLVWKRPGLIWVRQVTARLEPPPMRGLPREVALPGQLTAQRQPAHWGQELPGPAVPGRKSAPVPEAQLPVDLSALAWVRVQQTLAEALVLESKAHLQERSEGLSCN